MTTVTDPNVFNLAIRGTFDDGQRIVKEIFGDLEFKNRYALGAVNSINWARVLAQIVYYFYAWARVREKTGNEEICVAVPTGNFGDIFAGYLARRMGLPIERLILATNANNILARFVREGDYSIGSVVETYSPSMDIQISSNFERYLFYLYDCDALRVREAMEQFRTSGRLAFDPNERRRIATDFSALAVDNQQTLQTIRNFKAETGYLLDPHTAVGVRAAQDTDCQGRPIVCLATAHPAKFGEAVHLATGEQPPQPSPLRGIESRERRCEVIDADTATVKAFICSHAIN
jgi:threonine synthase